MAQREKGKLRRVICRLKNEVKTEMKTRKITKSLHFTLVYFRMLEIFLIDQGWANKGQILYNNKS